MCNIASSRVWRPGLCSPGRYTRPSQLLLAPRTVQQRWKEKKKKQQLNLCRVSKSLSSVPPSSSSLRLTFHKINLSQCARQGQLAHTQSCPAAASAQSQNIITQQEPHTRVPARSHSATLWTTARQASLSMGFSQREYWSGLPLPPPGDLPDPGMEAVHLMSLRRQLGSLPLVPPGKPISRHRPFPLPTSPWQPQIWLYGSAISV